jgi:hypothetical protein
MGEAKYVDDPRGWSVLQAWCRIDPVSGQPEVLVEGDAEFDRGHRLMSKSP